MTRRKGITLVELIIAMALSVIVLAVGVQFFSISVRATGYAGKEVQAQADSRLFAEEVNSSVRYAKALFAIPESSFRKDNLTKGWSYLGIMKNVTIPAEKSRTRVAFEADQALVSMVYLGDTATGTLNPGEEYVHCDGGVFLQRILGYSYEDPETKNKVLYKLTFKKSEKKSPSETATPNSEEKDGEKMDRYIRYVLEAEMQDPSNQKVGEDYLKIDTALDALNSLQVVRLGTDVHTPSVAIAYRKDARVADAVAHVAMVLDRSGSMKEGIDESKPIGPTNLQRLGVLKKRGGEFVDKLSEDSGIDVGLIPFSSCLSWEIYGYVSNANDLKSKIFKNASQDAALLKSRINYLTPDGGTNPGDGLRYAAVALNQHKASTGQKVMRCVVVFMDGGPNSYSIGGSVHDHGMYRNYGNLGIEVNPSYYTGTAWNPDVAEFYRYSQGRSPGEYRYYDRNGQLVDNSYDFDVMIPYRTGLTLTHAQRLAFWEDRSVAYVKKVYDTLYGDIDQVFLIAFSNSVSEEGVMKMRGALGNLDDDHVFTANSDAGLQQAFLSIQKKITGDLWYLRGPQL